MNFRLTTFLLSSLFIISFAFSQNKMGQFATYKLKAKKFDLMEYKTEIGSFDQEKKSYQHLHFFELPFFGKRELSSQIKDIALNSHLKWQAIKFGCTLMKGQLVTLTISGQNIDSCQLSLEYLPKETLDQLYQLKILKRLAPLKGEVFLADIPVWGIAKIETKYLSLEAINFKW
ncbi:hypothetical protein N9N67_08855 [Bacteriovoracaceae bacterium]|nr:hypothetical protein [Bacteriovoracaceae bacterium]